MKEKRVETYDESKRPGVCVVSRSVDIATIGVEDARTLKLKHIFYKITTLCSLFLPIFTSSQLLLQYWFDILDGVVEIRVHTKRE